MPDGDYRLPGAGRFGRSAKREVRNPVLALPATQRILDLPPEQRRPLGLLLRQLAAEADDKAEHAWRTRKGIMAAYWRAVATYAKHLAHAIDPRPFTRHRSQAEVEADSLYSRALGRLPTRAELALGSNMVPCEPPLAGGGTP